MNKLLTLFAKFHRWEVIVLIAVILAVLGLELLGVFDRNYITITALVRTYLPKWARALILGAAFGWTYYHFVIQ